MQDIHTTRLIISRFKEEDAYDVHQNSLDDDVLRFVPDEYFASESEALDVLQYLISRYESVDGPFVYPVLLKDNTNIGYVQRVKLEKGWEVGYHIASKYRNLGYATEALSAFLRFTLVTFTVDTLYGIAHKENKASHKVLTKCGFTFLHEDETRNQTHFIYKK